MTRDFGRHGDVCKIRYSNVHLFYEKLFRTYSCDKYLPIIIICPPFVFKNSHLGVFKRSFATSGHYFNSKTGRAKTIEDRHRIAIWLLLIGRGRDSAPNSLPRIPMDTTNKTSLLYFDPLHPLFLCRIRS
jgi:hypothetical protein